MSNWWSKHPVGPLAPLGWDAVADCEYQGGNCSTHPSADKTLILMTLSGSFGNSLIRLPEVNRAAQHAKQMIA
jgi:hypothetical protein